jgi:hypothetical protein
VRIFILSLTFGLILLPALLILFARHKPLRMRILWGMAAFLMPFIMLGLVNLVPGLVNHSPDSSQAFRFLGLVLSGAGFFLPWILFAVFLHKREPS